ncbi:MAG: hypothetical protein NT075_18185 [Chloroflexi bacterium]|nr:hypothetical protein [Chloroflexota bacterium]
MMGIKRIEHGLLIVLDAFLAVTAIAGGIGLLTGVLDPGVQLLQGSPFSSYTIPGLALLVLVGGSALLATGLMLRLPERGVLTSGITGVIIIGFEVIEVLVVGSDPGIARNLQIFYFTLGLLIALLAALLWLAQRKVNLGEVRQGKIA